jgi:hypothetical protein
MCPTNRRDLLYPTPFPFVVGLESSSRIHRACKGIKASLKVGLKGGNPTLKLGLTPVQAL